ncbi:hypothetical protein D3C77_749940 [compost metagenome]
MKRVFWKAKMGLPNTLRPLVYSRVLSSTARAPATLLMAMDKRSQASSFINWKKP